MQSVSSRIWTRVAVSISYDDNDYTTGNSILWWGSTSGDIKSMKISFIGITPKFTLIWSGNDY